MTDGWEHSVEGRSVLWRLLDGHGMDWCSLHRNGDGWGMFGRAVLTFDGVPGSVQYGVLCDAAWRTHTVTVNCTDGLRDRHLSLRRGENGWRVMNQPCADLDGCVDVDLESSAMTNTVPVHRLALSTGESAQAPATYVRAVDLHVERLDQRYARTGDEGPRQRYDYTAPAFDFSCRLVYDESGLVLAYPGIAQRAWHPRTHANCTPISDRSMPPGTL